MKRILIVLTASVAMMSCVTKPYKSPQTQHIVDSLYRVLESKVDTTANEAEVSWRDFFTDKLLVAYIDEALKNNLDMRMAYQNVQIAQAQFRQKNADFFPSLNATVGGGLMAQSNTPLKMAYQVGATASWEIDVWGKLASAKRSTLASMLQQQDAVQALQTSIVAQIATMYYTLVAYDVELNVINSTIEVRRSYVETTRSMKESAKVNEVAVQQAIAQLEEVLVAKPQIELAIISTENALRLLLGKTSGHIERHPIIDITDSKLVTLIGCPAQLLSNRPDVRAAENGYRAAFEMWNMSRAALYPSLSISAEGTISDVFASHFGVLNVLGGLTQPIFNGRKLRAQKDIAGFTAEQAKDNFFKTLLTAGQEVSNALATQMKTQEIAIAQVRQLAALKKAYEYSMDLFVNGYATYLDVLMAQTGVFNTEMSLIQTYLDNLSARIELYRTLGGGHK